jgi:hypothetical protein
MNIKVTTFAIISLIAAGTLSVLPASAKGARFDFAPNTFGGEVYKQRHGNYVPVHAVTHGGMPRSSSFLGVDPRLLAKPAPPPPPAIVQHMQTQIAMPVAQVTPKMLPQHPPAQFNNAFGTPIGAKPPVIAQAAVPMAMPVLPQVAPQAAVAKPLTVAKKPVVRVARSNNVSGKLLRRKSAPAAVAHADNGIASYGNSLYVPGAFIPVSGSGGISRTGNVYGKVLPHHAQ